MDIRGINNRNINSSLHEYESMSKENTAKKDDKKIVSGGKSDKIQISSEAKQLSIVDFATNKIKSELQKEQKEVSADKLNRLKAQIKNGSYKIGAQAIANAVLSGAAE